ncbi:MAG TPA: hypothetical protein ENG51_23695 [Deltaproteobacteria bacterium]|nr:hypothetical protein [Deltaproteobacteria bacterium]
MKIDTILPSSLNNQDKKSIQGKEKAPGTSFEQVLKKAKNSYQEGKTVSSVAEPCAVYAPLSVTPVQLTNSVSTALNMAEDALNSLEKFGEFLSRPVTQPNKLERVVTEMSSTARKLEEVVSSLPQESSLKTMLEQISTLAAKEVAKYERGDYSG